MKWLSIMILMFGLAGCHHATKPPNLTADTQQNNDSVPAESLLADFAHRY